MFDGIRKLVSHTIRMFKNGETYKGIAYGGATLLLLAFPQYSEYVIGIGGALLTAVKTNVAIAETSELPTPTGGFELDVVNLDEISGVRSE